MGPIFQEKIPKHGSDFQNFSGFAMRTPEILKIRCVFELSLRQNRKKWVSFFGKIPKHGYQGTYFWKNYP